MPKAKTHSGASKRFTKLKSGRIKAAKSRKRHLLTKKTRKAKREMRRTFYVGTTDMRHVKPLLPS